MAFLNIAGIDYDVHTRGAVQVYERVGETFRNFDGGLRSTIRAEKKEYNFELGPMTTSDHTILESNVEFGKQVNVTGDALKGTNLTCQVEINNTDYNKGDFDPVDDDFFLMVDVTVREV